MQLMNLDLRRHMDNYILLLELSPTVSVKHFIETLTVTFL